jgi:hypothetical protein
VGTIFGQTLLTSPPNSGLPGALPLRTRGLIPKKEDKIKLNCFHISYQLFLEALLNMAYGHAIYCFYKLSYTCLEVVIPEDKFK